MNRLFARTTSTLPTLSMALLLMAMFVTNVMGQSITGVVTDADDGFPLAGANVAVYDDSGRLVTGNATGIDGRYTIETNATGTFSVRARFVGFQEGEQNVTLSAGQTATVDFVLGQSGFELNTVVVAASRRQEKALDAPASISVLNAADVESSVGTSSVEALRTTPGVDMQQTGIDRREMVLRGFNNAFSGAAYILTDYRHAAVPSLNLNVYSILPSMNIDTDRIEVVRGPGSALYGAGVDQGVVHFITKDPFSHPGTTISIAGGERSYFGGQFRHAGVLGVDSKIGYKVTGMYGQANDWELDGANAEDAIQIAQDEGPRNTDYEKMNVNGTLEYRFSDKGMFIVNGGYATFTAAVLSGIGTVQADGFGYTYGQLRFQMDDFFAQVYMNQNSAGDSFVYGQDLDGNGQDDLVVDKGRLINAQAQYDFTMGGGKQKFIVGVDMELTRPDTEGTILGRNEDNDSISEYGSYLQFQTPLSPKLDLTLAARGDYNDVSEEFFFSPRAAIVFKPARDHSFRVTYNRAFSSPTSNSNFLDIIAGQIPGTAINIRGRGSGTGFTWPRNAAYTAIAGSDLVASSLNPAALGLHTPVGLDLGATYASLYAGIAAIPTSALTAILQAQGLPVNDFVTATLVGGLSPAAGTNVTGFTRGILGKLNLTTFGMELGISDLETISPLTETTTETFEVGYKGVINNKLLFTVDAYYSRKENFVGPLLMETPFVFVPNLGNDLTAALAEGIAGNAPLSGALATFGLTPGAVAGLIVSLGADQLPDASTPIAIVQAEENDPGVGTTPELMLAYRNFGKVDFIGVDVSAQYMASDQLSLFGNVSFVDDTKFDETELEETGSGLELALNAPGFKGRFGFDYKLNNGFSFNAAGRYSDKFPILSGPYQGMLESYFLLDVGFGYDLNEYASGLRVDLGISNVTDNVHREFIGAPQLGRMGIARLTYSVK